ncbi:MAG: hypothetical protein ACLP9D_08175 [Candidatus Bathyarchaeia archaeon]
MQEVKNLASNRSSKLSLTLGVTIIVLLLDLLFVFYMTSHGLTSMNNELNIGGVGIQLQWLPVVGVLIVSLVAWYEAFTRIFPRWVGPEVDQLARVRLIRVIILSLTVFVCFLYVPFLLGSNWFWNGVSALSRSITQFRGFGNWLLSVETPILSLDPLWQYSVTQILACGALICFTWAFARSTRRLRKAR